MTRRMTRRDLVKLFKERGLRADRLLGQNFLVDHNVLAFMCRAAALGPGDVVLEIGAGTGLLTEHIARTGATVVGVEIDRNLLDIAQEYVGDAENVRLVRADIHGRRREINPEVQAALAQLLPAGASLKVASNLPYCISSDLLVSLLEMPRPPDVMVLTVQAEFADRLLARPGSRDYSALTVLLAAQSRVEPLRNIAADVFWPVPKVGSTIVRIAPDCVRRAEIGDYRLFKAVVAALFGQRRKTARGALRALARPRLSQEGIASALEASGILPRSRADGLAAGQIVALANRLRSRFES